MAGLEPATSRPPAVRASQLRHTPLLISLAGKPEMISLENQVGALTQRPRSLKILGSRLKSY